MTYPLDPERAAASPLRAHPNLLNAAETEALIAEARRGHQPDPPAPTNRTDHRMPSPPPVRVRTVSSEVPR